MKKYYIKTFGCAMNQADSEKINMILLQSGFIKSNSIKDANLIIFNTCSVRQKWEDRVFGYINDIVKENKKNKKKIIWITGCMVRKTGMNEKYIPHSDHLLRGEGEKQNKRKRARKIEYIKDENWILNNDDKLFPRIKTLDFTLRIEEIKYLPEILSKIYDEKIWNDYFFDDYLKQKQYRENPAQASIIIQTWCDNYCTYCIVPYTRWKENSRDKNEILNEIKEAVKSWAKEIILIWQNVNSYWKQFFLNKYWDEKESKWKNEFKEKSPFRELLDEINKIEWIDRIRFTSSNPHDMTQDILEAHFDLDKTCNYLHFALQSWSNEMLKKMNRKHTYEDFKKMVNYLREKDPLFSISTDIIVWFSWETEEMFEETIKAIKECDFDFIYNARYSVRKGTIAAKLFCDDIPEKTKAERWHKVNELLKENVLKRNKMMIWRTELVLISWIKNWEYFWRTRNFKEIFFTSEKNLNIWDLVKVKLLELDSFVIKWKKVED